LNEQHGDLTPLNNEAIPPADQAPTTKPSTLRWVFLGADGLRAGWSILIFLALLIPLLKGLFVIIQLLHLASKGGAYTTNVTPTFLLIGESVPFLATLFVTWIMSKIERRPNSVYGLGGQRRLPHFFAGLAWGLICLSLLALTLWKTGLLVIDSRLLFGSDVLRYGAVWLFGFLLVGLLEEYQTRGYLLYTLTRGLAAIYKWAFKTSHSAALGFWTAALALSILFGLGHRSNSGESPIGLLAAGLAALIFCLSLWRTGSLWWAIGFHTAWDWAQSFLYGVADSGVMVQHHLLATHPVGKPLLSGGATGPEGSLFSLAILALVSLIIIFTLPSTRHRDAQELTPQPRPLEA
jgi:membrane protease YdiL (CAAX protease family)